MGSVTSRLGWRGTVQLCRLEPGLALPGATNWRTVCRPALPRAPLVEDGRDRGLDASRP